jgi:hypothetical protein
MENFWRRLKYYGIGFGIGLIFVIFFFKNKGCAWTPENRVKNAIFERILVIESAEMEELEKLNISKKELIQIIRNSDVDFQKSKKTDRFKVYHFDCQTKKGKKFSALITLGKDSFISEILLKEKNSLKAKNSKQGDGEIIHYPKERNFVFTDTTDLLICQKQAAQLLDNEKLYQQIKKNGTIDFKNSKLEMSPKPEHCIRFKDKKNREIKAYGIWHMDKIEIFRFDLSFKTDCSE